MPSDDRIEIAEAGERRFTLSVVFEGQRFDCGIYLDRGSAMRAGRLFLERKEGEKAGRAKRPRGKGSSRP